MKLFDIFKKKKKKIVKDGKLVYLEDLPERVGGWKHVDNKGRLHREEHEGPTILLGDHELRWYKHGKMHRESGPAVAYNDAVFVCYFLSNINLNVLYRDII